MKFEAFAHDVRDLAAALARLDKLNLAPDEYKFIPSQCKLYLAFTDFNVFHRALRQEHMNVTPAFSKSCIIVRNGWRCCKKITDALDQKIDKNATGYTTTQFGSNLLIYVVRGNVKKTLAAVNDIGVEASINSYFYQRQKDPVFIIKHDFVEMDDMNE